MKLGELFAPAPTLRSRLARLTGSPAPHAAPVAQILRGLPEGWFVFGDLGERCESTPDALAIGPGGVFSVTQASDQDDPACLRSSAILEARRATRLLQQSSGRVVGVRPVLVVNASSIPACPPEISVIRAGELLPWFRRQPPVLSRETVTGIARAAHRQETWA